MWIVIFTPACSLPALGGQAGRLQEGGQAFCYSTFSGIVFGHRYFSCRHKKNSATPTRGFACSQNIAPSHKNEEIKNFISLILYYHRAYVDCDFYTFCLNTARVSFLCLPSLANRISRRFFLLVWL